MDPASLALVVALSSTPARSEAFDLDAPAKAAAVKLDSPRIAADLLSAMALPYRYGVTQMPCKAKSMQPKRGWYAAREPAGRILWVQGPAEKVFWSGIYGTCLIQSPLAREKLPEDQRSALECECNGWLPRR